jgi:hypothetical protein
MNPEPLPGIIITAREIYDAVVRLAGRVDVLIEQQTNTHTEVQDHENRLRSLEMHSTSRERVQDHESRLRSLERSRWPLHSVAVLLSLAAVIMTLVQVL